MQSYYNKKFVGIEKDNIAISDIEFVECVFEGCKFVDCDFVDCAFLECKFINCSIVNMKAISVELKYVEFDKCTLVGIQWHKFVCGAIAFPISKLNNCFLKYNNFEEMNFRKFDFKCSAILSSTFLRCNLMESIFKNCDLKDTAFSDCNLQKSDFRGSNGFNINLLKNKVKGAKFSCLEAINLLYPFGIIID